MSDELGRTIGEYQLIELLYEQGDIRIYKGYQPRTERYVMVQLLDPAAAANQETVTQFLQGAKIAAEMNHPNILPLTDWGQATEVTYCVSPDIAGDFLQNQSYQFRDATAALALISQLCDGLAYIHGQGYIHGNLRPSTIFVAAEKRPLLSNFGYLPQYSGASNAYMSPEQRQGGVVDRRTDIYALGVLLYALLVGEEPPVGMTVSPRAKRPDLPLAVEQVIFKAMAQNPEQRFQHVDEFRLALQRALEPPAPAPVPPPPPVQSQPAPAPVAPSPSVSQTVTVGGTGAGTNWTAIIIGILFVALIGAAFLFFSNRPNDQEAQAPPTVEQPTVEQPPVQPPAQPPEAPPSEAPPEQPPAEQPPAEPPAEQPTEEPPAEQPPAEGDDGEGEAGNGGGAAGLPICGAAGLPFGLLLLGVAMGRRRQRVPKSA